MESKSRTHLSRLLGSCAVLFACVVPLGVFLRTQSAPGSSSSPTQSSQSKQQVAAPPSAQTAATEGPELNTQEAPIPLQSRVNLVPIRVVVRDAEGRAIPNLRKEDFRVFQDGKLQEISHFSIETPSSVAQTFVTSDSAAGSSESGKASHSVVAPSRFVALLFDDIYTPWEALTRARHAATDFIEGSLHPSDRVAVYTFSALSQTDFTADQDKLHSALAGLTPRPGPMGGQALPSSVFVDPLVRLDALLRRIAALPGQRCLVLLSSGFFYEEHHYQLSEIIDRANRANILINTVDPRGLYGPDMNNPNFAQELVVESEKSAILMVLPESTGGFAFRNNNDLNGGLRTIAAAPEVSYLVAFTPHDLKYDGQFHSLKVTLVHKERSVTIQARRGFYAPKHDISAEDEVNQEMHDALYSQEVQRGVPVELHIQFYRVDSATAKLVVVTRVDVGHIRFAKVQGRHQDNLIIQVALFDQDGNMITGIERRLEMNLLDVTLDKLSRTGVTVRNSFEVSPGDYMVRLVVRDSNAAQLSAENGVVQIPY